jgi:DNA-binding response OmpR family regulator
VNRALPRVLLVEDDPTIRRFVGLALEDEALELVEARSLAEARGELQTRPVDLLLTDLMLPDGHGTTLLEADLAAASRHKVVFSAGVDGAMRQRLQALGVAQILHKPVSLQALLDCVVALTADAGAEPGAVAEPPPPATPPADDGAARAIAAHFGGQATLFEAFRSAALAQFPADAAAGSAALAAHDVAALRRVAHNLGTALRLIGQDGLSRQARALEDEAASSAAPSERLAALWTPLEEGLRRLA